MGFDVYGKVGEAQDRKDSEFIKEHGIKAYYKLPAEDKHGGRPGEYFRNNIWWWGPLARFICEHAKEEAEPCEHWFTNDGDGLNAEQAVALADRLDELLADGTVDEHAKYMGSFSVENVQKFSEFARASGGFKIH